MKESNNKQLKNVNSILIKIKNLKKKNLRFKKKSSLRYFNLKHFQLVINF